MSTRQREANCRWCGRLVVCDDDKHTIHHEAPVCPRFDKFISALPGRFKRNFTLMRKKSV